VASFAQRRSRAISFWKAQASAVWWQLEEAPLPARGSHPRPRLDDIEAVHAAFVEQERNWRQFFQESAIQPLEIVYEHFVQDYVGTLERLLDHAGIERPVRLDLAPPRLRLQSDSFTKQLLDEYRPQIPSSTQPD